MKLILLGTGGFLPTDTAQTACFMLPEAGILLDAGSGLYRVSRYLQTTELDLYLSHAHGDHTSGLIYLFASFLARDIDRLRGAVDETNIAELVAKANDRLHAARVHATQPAIDFLSRAYEPYGLDWRLLSHQEALPGGGTLTSFSADHQDEVGFRLEWPGHSLAYVTDTTAFPSARYIEKIRSVDVLLHDCYGPDRLAELIERTGHSTLSSVARVAALAQVRRLILVHLSPFDDWSVDPDLEAARAIFPATDMGMDGMEIDF